MNNVHIQLMNNFVIYVNDMQEERLTAKTRKGVALIQYLILANGEQVPNYRLIADLWPDDTGANPENALKTLISRLRGILNQISDGLGYAIVADRGAYHWEMQPNMTVDVYQIEDIFRQYALYKNDTAKLRGLYQNVIELYKNDLFESGEGRGWATARASSLHNQYLNTVYAYIDILKAEGDHDGVICVARKALDIDAFDDRLHMELMEALSDANRTNEATMQYKQAVQLNYRYLGTAPGADLQAYYKRLINRGRSLDFNMEEIRHDLKKASDQNGAFVCEYNVFCEIYNLQKRNLERLKCPVFLAVIMLGDPSDPADAMRQGTMMNNLLEILKWNLRRGDTIAQYSSNMYALLLPKTTFSSASMVMERVRDMFYLKYPNTDALFNFRVTPVEAQPVPVEPPIE